MYFTSLSPSVLQDKILYLNCETTPFGPISTLSLQINLAPYLSHLKSIPTDLNKTRSHLIFLAFCNLNENPTLLKKFTKRSKSIIKTQKESISQKSKSLVYRSDLSLPSDSNESCILCGTPFQHQVWKTLLNIPLGETRSYGEIANQIHSHPRAVGRAVGSNPISYFVPCHRVLAQDGSLNGYLWGLEVKRQLLQFEQATFKEEGKSQVHQISLL